MKSLRVLSALLSCAAILASAALSKASILGDFGPQLQRVASTRGWSHGGLEYQWMPDGRIFVWTGEWPKSRAVLVNPRTGEQNPLDAFNRGFGPSPHRGPEGKMLAQEGLLLSPDGKFVLWFDAGYLKPPSFWRTLSLDGSQSLVEKLDPHYYWTFFAAWEWNDHYRGWIELLDLYITNWVVAHFDLAHPDQVRYVTLQTSALPAWASNIKQPLLRLLGVTASGEGIISPYVTAQATRVRITLVDINTGTKPPHEALIQLPSGAEMVHLVASPDGRHIAWLLRFHRPHLVLGRERRYPTDEIWISGVDGSNMHRLGYQIVHYQSLDDSLPDDGIGGLAWKNNNSVSFVWKEILYSVPIRQ